MVLIVGFSYVDALFIYNLVDQLVGMRPITVTEFLGHLCRGQGVRLVWIANCGNTQVDLSRFCAAPRARLSHFPFERDRAFPAEG